MIPKKRELIIAQWTPESIAAWNATREKGLGRYILKFVLGYLVLSAAMIAAFYIFDRRSVTSAPWWLTAMLPALMSAAGVVQAIKFWRMSQREVRIASEHWDYVQANE